MDADDNAWCRLGSPVYIVAPMIDASELAWRMLCRKHGAQLCYTPMLHSGVFARDPKYRDVFFTTCKEDRPLVVQFAGNDPETLLKAALLAEPYCDCIDINLGCPQSIAKRGHYGAFLQDEWQLITKMVQTLRNNLKIPVSCKIRIFQSIPKSVSYAQMLESAGCQLLAVNGRTREQKGPLTGLASWDHVKAIREAVRIPIIANGNIQYLSDLHRCINYTGCNGVMCAEGILTNPTLFEGISLPVWEIATEYLDFTDNYPCPISFIRSHMFKLMHKVLLLPENKDLQIRLSKAKNVEEFRQIVSSMKERYEDLHEGRKCWDISSKPNYSLQLPPWLCQPYVRISPEEHLMKMAEAQRRQQNSTDEKENSVKRMYEESTAQDEGSSVKKQEKNITKFIPRKLLRKKLYEFCSLCRNPSGKKCIHKLCKVCCIKKCKKEELTCIGHGVRLTENNKTNAECSLNATRCIIQNSVFEEQ